MPLFYLVILALVQGITEFLPISSSAHLILLPTLTGMPDQGRAIDVAVHIGTLGAVMIYFWSDIRRAIIGLPKLARRQIDDQNAWLALCLIIATIPVVLMGFVAEVSGIEDMLRSVKVIAWTTIIFGVLLWWFDQKSPSDRTAEQWSLRHALIMGLWQVIALIPGVSRSGITMTGGRQLGYSRVEAARLSMLMSVPTIAASGLLIGIKLAAELDGAALREGAIAAVFSFAAALIALSLMMRFLKTTSFTPYVIYRIVLGVALLAYSYA